VYDRKLNEIEERAEAVGEWNSE